MFRRCVDVAVFVQASLPRNYATMLTDIKRAPFRRGIPVKLHRIEARNLYEPVVA